MKKAILTFIILLLAISPASAIIIKSVIVDPVAPGGQGTIRIEVENTLNTDKEDVSISLKFTETPFIPVGKSQETAEEIDEGDEEDFVFRIRTDIDTNPGNYEIPYILEYEDDGDEKTREGTIGIQVQAEPELTFSASTENPVVGRQGQVTLRIINKGLFDARFVTVKVLPEGYTLLSESEAYIGEVESDDFETENFNVVFGKTNPNFRAVVSYRNFDNEEVLQQVDIPLTVYTQERALQLGIIQQSSVGFYVGLVIVIIILIVIWRTVKKRRRLKKSMKRE
jgi:hypothetical protein